MDVSWTFIYSEDKFTLSLCDFDALSPPELEEGEHVSQAHTTSVALQCVCVCVCVCRTSS